MQAAEFCQSIITHLPYAPNWQQEQVIAALARFCSPLAPHNAVFLLAGYAGTGKTSLTAALVKALRDVGIASVLLAPTGRAAKVFSTYAGHPACTIHRYIYRHGMPSAQGDQSPQFSVPRENNRKDTIFIVDEASMISGRSTAGSEQAVARQATGSATDLLHDLIHHVYSGDNCRMILLGDTAQLPPVGCDRSPAMQPEVLRSYGLRVSHATLTSIARQGAGSGILAAATALRQAVARQTIDPAVARQAIDPPAWLIASVADRAVPADRARMDDWLRPTADRSVPRSVALGSDIKLITPIDLPEVIETCYANDGIDETILITYSNQRATAFNTAIRSQVLFHETELQPGDPLLVVKNNYHWTRTHKDIDFLANGDVVTVSHIYGTETRYGMRFADVQLTPTDRTDTPFQAKIILDTLTSETASLSRQQLEQLYYNIISDPELFDKTVPYPVRLKALADNPYRNALQTKYAYAVTCHKAQGGQWRNVIVDMGFVPADVVAVEYYRWLYTAITRARTQLYIITPENT